MKKGEVWIVDLSKLDEGSEQKGYRPVCIVFEGEANVATIIPFTSNLKALRFKNTLEIKPTINNNLRESSVALIFQMRAIDKIRLKHKIGFLESETVKEIDSILINMLGLK